MIDNKLFSTANGRLFRIQAVVRNSGGKSIVLAKNLTQAQCERYEPSYYDKKLYKSFRVAFNDSKLK